MILKIFDLHFDYIFKTHIDLNIQIKNLELNLSTKVFQPCEGSISYPIHTSENTYDNEILSYKT